MPTAAIGGAESQLERGAQPQHDEAIEIDDADLKKSAWVVRHVSGLPLELHKKFANRGRLNWHQIANNETTIRSLLKDNCGDQRSEVMHFLVEYSLEINGKVNATDKLAKDEVIGLPFCFKVVKNVQLELPDNKSYDSVLINEIGFAGTETRKAVYNENNSGEYTNLAQFENSLKPGDKLKLPVAAPKTVFLPRANAPGEQSNHPNVIIEAYSQVNSVNLAGLLFEPPSKLKELPQFSARSNPNLGKLQLVSAVKLTGQELSDACKGGIDEIYSPPSSVAMQTAYETTLNALDAEGHRTAVIGIIDTGLMQYGDDFFKKDLFHLNQAELRGTSGVENDRPDTHAYEYTDDIVGASIDKSGDISPLIQLPNEKKIHGTQMASLALGGRDIAVNWLGGHDEPPIKLRIFQFAEKWGDSGRMADGGRLQDAVNYLVETGANIINLSLATSFKISALQDAIKRHPDVLFVVAAGNGFPGGTERGVDISLNRIRPALFGGRDGLRNVVTVGGLAFDSTRALFSNKSVDHVNFLAPACGLQVRNPDGTFGIIHGTSGSAALTSFASGLLYSLGLSDAVAIRERLQASADYNIELAEDAVMPGALNLLKAVSFKNDVIQMKERQNELIYGEISDPRTFFAACKKIEDAHDFFDTVAPYQVLKVAPNIKLENGGIAIKFWIDSDGMRERECEQIAPDQSPHFVMSKMTVEGRQVNIPAISEIHDVVFKVR